MDIESDMESLHCMMSDLDANDSRRRPGGQSPLLTASVNDEDEKSNNGTLIAAIRTVEDPSHQMRIIKHIDSKNGLDLTETDKQGRNGLMLASLYGYKITVGFLLTEKNMDYKTVDNEGNTCLMLATERGNDDVAKFILDYVKSICVNDYEALTTFLDRQNERGDTAVSLALKNGHVDSANVLSEYIKLAAEGGFDKQRRDIFSKHQKPSLPKRQTSDPKHQHHASVNFLDQSSLASSKLHRSSEPDFGRLIGAGTDYYGNPSNKTALNVHHHHHHHHPIAMQAAASANISIRVGFQFDNNNELVAQQQKPTFTFEDVPQCQQQRSSEQKRWVQNMIKENQNVKRHHKVQKLFRVDSEGSPSAEETPMSSPEVGGGRSARLASRVRRLMDRRVQYAANEQTLGRYSYDPQLKSHSSSDDDSGGGGGGGGLSPSLTKPKTAVRSKSSGPNKPKSAEPKCCNTFKLPPLKGPTR